MELFLLRNKYVLPYKTLQLVSITSLKFVFKTTLKTIIVRVPTKSVEVEVVTVVKSGSFTVDVVPIIAYLILLVEGCVIRTQEPEVLNLRKQLLV